MKKSMAGKKVAGTLLLAGLMMSAGAMAASGDPVQGGSGSVTINVPIVTSTCSVAVPTEVNFDPFDQKSIIGDGLYRDLDQKKNMDITLSDCSGKTLQMTTQAHTISSYDNLTGNFSSGDPDHALGYRIYIPNVAEITGGYATTDDNWIIPLNSAYPLTIKPNSDSYRIASSIVLRRFGINSSNLGTTLSGGFDYTFTYQ
ncbi:type 1 fimbrial protein [Salmonella enterica]|nr:type 1 fimbrial protein [Salmonella enterica]